MVELDAEQVDVREQVGHPRRPAPGVGDVADGDGPAAAVGLGLDPEPERRAAVVPERQRLDPDAARA